MEKTTLVKKSLEGDLAAINAKKTLEGEPPATNANATKKKKSKRLAWADEVGGALLATCREYDVEHRMLPVFSKGSTRRNQSDFIEGEKDEQIKKKQLQVMNSEVGEACRGGELRRSTSRNDEDESRIHVSGRSSTIERGRVIKAEKGKLPAPRKSYDRGNLKDLKEGQSDDNF